jgi:hypothetical protein
MRKFCLIICVICLTLIIPDIVKATIPVIWQANPDGSGLPDPSVTGNTISRVKLTPDKNNVMVFHYNGGADGIPTRVDKLAASTGDFVWPLPGYKTVTKPGQRLSLNGWVDCNGNLWIMSSWSGYTIWKYDSELDTELCSYTGGSGFEYVVDAIDDCEYLYVAGMTGSGSNEGSRLVKLRLSDCSLIYTCVSKNTSQKDDYCYGIALDSSKNIFRVGTDSSPAYASYRGRLIGHNASNCAEFFNYTVNETKSIISGITIDSNDYIYIAYCYDYTPSGQERTVVQRLERVGSTANVVWEHRFEDIGMYLCRDAIVKHTGNSFYVAFNQRQDGTTVPGIAEFDLDGNLLWKDTIDRPGWTLSSIDAKDNYIYVGLSNNADTSQTQVLCLRICEPVAYWSFDYPGWFTDQPLNYYSSSGKYRVQPENRYPGYTPSRAGFKPLLLSEPLPSFTLKWDMKVASCDSSISIPFGLYDKSLSCHRPGPGDQYVVALAGISGADRFWGIIVGGVDDYNQVSTHSGPWDFNTWYTCELAYNAGTKKAKIDVKLRGSEPNICTATVGVPGGFTHELMYLGSSSSGIGDNYTYPAGIDPDARADAYIDNVWLGFCSPPCVTVPNVVGMCLRDAKAALEAERLTVGSITWRLSKTVKCCTVTDQKPSEGTRLCDDKKVDLTVAAGWHEAGGPTMRTDDANEVGRTGAKLNGTVLDDDGECGVLYRFVYWEVGNAIPAYSTPWTGCAIKGESFGQVVTGLKPKTIYEFYVQGRNSTGTSYNGRKKFTTQPVLPP